MVFVIPFGDFYQVRTELFYHIDKILLTVAHIGSH